MSSKALEKPPLGTTSARRVRCGIVGAPRRCAPLKPRVPIDHAIDHTRPRRPARRRIAALAADAADASAQTSADAAADAAYAGDDAEAAVSNLLGWVQANGVDTSRVGVFVEPSGERGIVAASPTAKGDALLVVPLRLAIADYAAAAAAAPADPDQSGTYYPGAPWSVRLASRLLREAGAGARSPWSAYVRALPRRVPSAASAWGWDAARRLRDARAEDALHRASWLADDAFERLLSRAAEAWGPELAAQADAAPSIAEGAAFLRERWDWALACVHSRTFLVGTRDGAGARAMLPLLDLCNHAGDEARCDDDASAAGGGRRRRRVSFGRAAAQGARARDNVRWDAVRARRALPGGGGGGGGEEWALALTALRPLVVGEELLLSYGERANDDFLCHYGFVPPLNPHDDVALFSASSLASSAAAAAAAAAGAAAGARGALEEAAEWHWAVRGGAAAAAGDEEEEKAARQRYVAAVDKALAAEAEEQGRPAGAGPRTEGGAVEQAFALRVVAGSRVSPGLVALLAELEGGGGGGARRAELLVARRCWQLLLERGCSLLGDLAALALDEAARRRRLRRQQEQGEQEDEDEQEEEEGPFASWFLPHYYRSLVVERGLCSLDGEWRRRAMGKEEEAGAAAAEAAAAADEGDADPAALARRLVGGRGEETDVLGEEERIARTFRAYKGMILADCVVDSGASLGDLVD